MSKHDDKKPNVPTAEKRPLRKIPVLGEIRDGDTICFRGEKERAHFKSLSGKQPVTRQPDTAVPSMTKIDEKAGRELPPMLSNSANVTRRIRRCDNEQSAQVVLEHFAREYARAALAQQAAVPEGFCLVPEEPTEDMMRSGAHSEPSESFSEPELWREFQGMSGCRQAEEKARLCYLAMLAAAPEAPAALAQQEGVQEGKAFVVTGDYDYDCDMVVRAFASKAEAKGFVDECREYDMTCPYCNSHDEAAIKKWRAERNAWIEHHPAGLFRIPDGYSVHDVPAIGLTTAPEAPSEQGQLSGNSGKLAAASAGESSFESWYDNYRRNSLTIKPGKQRLCDAYAAGMADPLAAAQGQQAAVSAEPVLTVTVEAVATVARDEDGEFCLNWLIEGGEAALAPGETLLIANERITDNTGSGEVVRVPAPKE